MQGTYLGRVGQRLLQVLPSVLGIIIVTFLLTRALPGDPTLRVAGSAADDASRAKARLAQGVDKASLPVQFWHYAVNLFQGDLGQSLSTGEPVLQALARRLPVSLELTFSGLLLAMATAIPLGALSAAWPDSWMDHSCRWIAMAGVSLPTFLTGLLLAYLFDSFWGWAPPSARLNVLPPPGSTGFYLIDSLIAVDLAAFWSALKQLALPAATLAIFALVPLVCITRDAVAQVLASDFLRTAWANGLSRRQVLWTYALRNAMLPVLSALGMVLSLLLGANILVEHVFAWPGMGAFAMEALAASDVVAVQGFVLVMALLFVLLNLGIDILYTCIDPRVRMDA